MLYIACNFSD